MPNMFNKKRKENKEIEKYFEALTFFVEGSEKYSNLDSETRLKAASWCVNEIIKRNMKC